MGGKDKVRSHDLFPSPSGAWEKHLIFPLISFQSACKSLHLFIHAPSYKYIGYFKIKILFVIELRFVLKVKFLNYMNSTVQMNMNFCLYFFPEWCLAYGHAWGSYCAARGGLCLKKKKIIVFIDKVKQILYCCMEITCQSSLHAECTLFYFIPWMWLAFPSLYFV